MALLEFPPDSAEPRRRWAGIALAGVVHALLISFILVSLPTASSLLPTQHEIFYFFHPVQKPPRPKSRMIPIPSARRSAPPPFQYTPQTPSSALTSPAVTGLGLSLFGCAPENLANLSPEEREHCSGALGLAALQSAIPGSGSEHAEQANRWAAAMRRRNSPLLLPCFKPDGPTPVDFICMGRGLVDGFDIRTGDGLTYDQPTDVP